MNPSARLCRFGAWAVALLAAVAPARAENLLANGGFDHKDGALYGWITDYEFTGNRHYVGNKARVRVENGAALLDSPGDQGAKMECIPIPFEPGFCYTAEFKVKGGPYRIYFAGYKWNPGVRPHDKPALGELRLIYKSKALAGQSRSWEKKKVELPGVELSARAMSTLGQVRFLTLYIWMLRPGSIDNVTITKTADPKMKF